MYLGKIVEMGLKEAIFSRPRHPYTIALLSVTPIPAPKVERKRVELKREVPNPINPPSGCRFHSRCPMVMDICRTEEPRLLDVENAHVVACHLFG